MKARMDNPATVIPEVMPAIQDLIKAAKKGGVPETVLELVHLRASQINGCGFCVDLGARQAYDQWTQYQEFSRFAKGVVNVEQNDEITTSWQTKVAKSNRSWKASIVEQVADERIAWTSEGPKGTTKGVVTFHSLDDNLTKVLLVLEYFPKGLFEKTGNIWRAQGRRARLDLKLFRKFVTMKSEPAEGWRGEIRDGEVVREHDDAVKEEEEQKQREEGGEGEDRADDEDRPEGEESQEDDDQDSEADSEADSDEDSDEEGTEDEEEVRGREGRGRSEDDDEAYDRDVEPEDEDWDDEDEARQDDEEDWEDDDEEPDEEERPRRRTGARG
ncbi:SRPBCC family protein [Streptomyces lavendulocolor]|uniref:SRPBCC family protein n=1 Tax=Streptomyces lavendulocolor TaxID=67316 RepID=UPI0033D784D8